MSKGETNSKHAFELVLVLDASDRPRCQVKKRRIDITSKAKAMRSDFATIMLTAYGDAGTKRKALKSGAELSAPSMT